MQDSENYLFRIGNNFSSGMKQKEVRSQVSSLTFIIKAIRNRKKRIHWLSNFSFSQFLWLGKGQWVDSDHSLCAEVKKLLFHSTSNIQSDTKEMMTICQNGKSWVSESFRVIRFQRSCWSDNKPSANLRVRFKLTGLACFKKASHFLRLLLTQCLSNSKSSLIFCKVFRTSVLKVREQTPSRMGGPFLFSETKHSTNKKWMEGELKEVCEVWRCY